MHTNNNDFVRLFIFLRSAANNCRYSNKKQLIVVITVDNLKVNSGHRKQNVNWRFEDFGGVPVCIFFSIRFDEPYDGKLIDEKKTNQQIAQQSDIGLFCNLFIDSQ
jgi:hypothetical protein